MTKIALCDDNVVFLRKLHCSLKEKFKKTKIDFEIFDYTSGKLLLIQNESVHFDVIFLDIDMPELNGFDVAKTINAINENCYVIFVTSHSELVYDSFYLRPLNFVTKSDDEVFDNKLSEVINQLLNNMTQDTTIIIGNKEIGRHSFLLKNVLYIESNKHYSVFHILGEQHGITVHESISSFEEKYKSNDFIRIHKKYLVNLRHVFNLDKSNDTVIFKQKFELPVSRNYKSEVDEMLTLFLRRMRG